MPTVSEFKAQAEQLTAQGQHAKARKIYEHLIAHLESGPAIEKELELYELAGDAALQAGDADAGIARYEQGAERYAAAGDADRVRALVAKVVEANPKRGSIYRRITIDLLNADHVEAARLVLIDYARHAGREKTVEQLEKLHSFPPDKIRKAIKKALGFRGTEAVAAPAEAEEAGDADEVEEPSELETMSNQLVIEHTTPEPTLEPEPAAAEAPPEELTVERASVSMAQPEPEAAEQGPGDDLMIERGSAEEFSAAPAGAAPQEEEQKEEEEEQASDDIVSDEELSRAPRGTSWTEPPDEAAIAAAEEAASAPEPAQPRVGRRSPEGIPPPPPRHSTPPPRRRVSGSQRIAAPAAAPRKKGNPLAWVLVLLLLVVIGGAGLQFSGIYSFTDLWTQVRGGGAPTSPSEIATEGGPTTTQGQEQPALPADSTPAESTAVLSTDTSQREPAGGAPLGSPFTAAARPVDSTARQPDTAVAPLPLAGPAVAPDTNRPTPAPLVTTPVAPPPSDSVVTVADLPIEGVVTQAGGGAYRVTQRLASGEPLTVAVQQVPGPAQPSVTMVGDTAIGVSQYAGVQVTLRAVMTAEEMQTLLGRLVKTPRP